MPCLGWPQRPPAPLQMVLTTIEGKPTIIGLATCTMGAAVLRSMLVGRYGSARSAASKWSNITRREIIMGLWPNFDTLWTGWVHLAPCHSIGSYQYMRKARLLCLAFRHGKSYMYLGVQPRTVKSLLRSAHKGNYFNRYIKGEHTCLHLW